MNGPLLSIVIANYNYGRFLEETLESVFAQGMGNKVELIICDAASTDNSVDIIEKYANGLPPNVSYINWINKNSTFRDNSQLLTTKITWWCSEKDDGQAAAFNKGFAKARGEWITWLNSDEVYMPGSLKAFERIVTRKTKAEWITANMLSFDSETRIIRKVNWGPHLQLPLLKRNRSFCAVYGTTTFWKKSLYTLIGPLDETLNYAMDTEYWLRMHMRGVKPIRLRHIVWAFRDHEFSKTVGKQNEETIARKLYEHKYVLSKTGYNFRRTVFNVWYLIWIFWRILDGSWIVRFILKTTKEGSRLCACGRSV